MNCLCGSWSFNGPPEIDPECPMHGDIDVLQQIMEEDEYLRMLQARIKIRISSMYGKESRMSYPVAPHVKYTNGLAQRAMTRQDSWLHSYEGMIEGVTVEYLAGATHPSGRPGDVQYQLSFGGNTVSKTSSLDFTRNLIEFLQHIVDAESPRDES